MADIFHDFQINAPSEKVFQAISTPAGLDAWWTEHSSGVPEPGSEYELWFGPECAWRAVVSQCVVDRMFEFQITSSDADWMGTRVGFSLDGSDGTTNLRFHHTGWHETHAHYRISSFCWAMYLRLLKRYIELGEVVPYEKRDNA